MSSLPASAGEDPAAPPRSLGASIDAFESAMRCAGLVVTARSEDEWRLLVRRHMTGWTYGGAFTEAIRQPSGAPVRLTPAALETILDRFASIWKGAAAPPRNQIAMAHSR